MNEKPFEKAIAALQADIELQRETEFARKLLRKQIGKKTECVWTGKAISLENEAHMDHMLPFSYWQNNDLWNLLPADPKINLKKRDRVPTCATLQSRKNAITEIWSFYQKENPGLFQFQMERALSMGTPSLNWKQWAFDGLCFLAERGISTYGLEPFSLDG